MLEETARPPDPKIVQRIVEAALLEDGARSDVTTKAVIPEGEVGRAAIIAKEGGVLAGLPVAAATFAALDQTIRYSPLVPDGSVISAGDRLVEIEGALSPILSGERVALNFLQQLSGVATAAHELVEAVAGLNGRYSDGGFSAE